MLILHGDNLLASRKRLVEEIRAFRQKGKVEVIRLLPPRINLTDLKQALESSSLFNQDRLVVLEQLFSGRNSATKQIADYLSRHSDTNVILWENKKLPATTISSLKARQQLFELPKVIYKLLDNFIPGNRRQLINLFQQTMTNQPAELIFFLLVRHIKDLIIVSDAKSTASFPAWKTSSLSRQAARFKPADLTSIFKRLLDIEWGIKSGQSPLSLKYQLELLFCSI